MVHGNAVRRERFKSAASLALEGGGRGGAGICDSCQLSAASGRAGGSETDS